MNNQDYAKKEWLNNIEMHEGESTTESIATFILMIVAMIVLSVVFMIL